MGVLARVGLLLAATAGLTALLIFVLGPGTPAAAAGEGGIVQTAAFQTTDKVTLSVALENPTGKTLEGRLGVMLITSDGRVVHSDKIDVAQATRLASYRFEFQNVKQRPDQLKGRFDFQPKVDALGGRKTIEVPLEKILVVKAHETTISAGQEFFSGSPSPLRVGVHGVKSVAESIPLADANVVIRMKLEDGKDLELFKGRVDRSGYVDANVSIPKVKPGTYKIEVATTSTLGQEKIEKEVRIKSEPKILLVTDKPLYQPGQLIHIRAMALRPFDLNPVEPGDIVFEVEDAKGNKVFKRTHKTSEFGIASVDFQLADEVNAGEYQVRALLGNHEARKTVTVKKYVLPKFKVNVASDKKFYMPKETITVEVQSDYFFGKPVAGGTVKLIASTFDVQFKDFAMVEAKTDANGHAKFEVKLPDYFVGQPLAKGDALVKLEVKLTDTAEHAETVTKMLPVSDQAIRVSLVPEAGRLVPNIENRVFAAAIYPDGSPAADCEVKLWTGTKAEGQPVATVKTNAAGLAEFTLTPKAEQFRQGQWAQRNVEMLGGKIVNAHAPQILFDVTAEAKDAKGNVAKATAALNSEPMGENILLRLDKAIYRGGDTIRVDVRSSAGMPTTYLDVVKSGQTLLTQWLDVKDGKAATKLDLPASVFGTLEIHAYQILSSGEIIRDARVVYVNPRDELKIKITQNQGVYKPGEANSIKFEVTDAAGKPTAAALGVIIVDEAVYALQEMQPGLEKVFFTLQEELIKPQANLSFRPNEPIDVLVREGDLPAAKQQIAQVLLAPIQPKRPARWEVNPAMERRDKMQNVMRDAGLALWNYAHNKRDFMEKKDGVWTFKAGVLDAAIQQYYGQKRELTDPFGARLTAETLAKLESHFTPNNLASAITHYHMQSLVYAFSTYANQHKDMFWRADKWTFPETVLDDAFNHWVRQQLNGRPFEQVRKDLMHHRIDQWGNPVKLVVLDKKREHHTGYTQLDFHELVSAGPDGKFGTDDDVKLGSARRWHMMHYWWADEHKKLTTATGRFGGRDDRWMERERFAQDGGLPRPPMAVPDNAHRPQQGGEKSAVPTDPKSNNADQGGQKPVHVRNYFPETLLWQPALITDDQGVAHLPISFADSITTWRLTASASSKNGLLGGTTASLRVFQDFFVDLDLPVALTQNDEVAFPVAVYNYLKEAQTVTIELKQEPWFELVDEAGPIRRLALKPNEVTAVRFRIRAKKIGYQPLEVKAIGSTMSDAIRRSIEIVPNGQKVEVALSDRLAGRVSQSITIPDHAIPDSYKLMVKVYPGVMSQVLEGTEGMLRLPGG
jgi:5-hydroxyisourate hydrolase-like protein (transthyretin family)